MKEEIIGIFGRISVPILQFLFIHKVGEERSSKKVLNILVKV
jgi:hypothetical protein